MSSKRDVILMIVPALATVLSIATAGHAGPDVYTLTNLGTPPNADSTIGVRMNNLGHVAGYSIHYGQGEPSIRPWVWTPETGFTVLPPPPDTFLGRARAMDINDSGVVAGDGGFDSGLAWRYTNGVYETFGMVEDGHIAYLGGINAAGDVAGTSKDTQITTEDNAFLAVNGAGLVNLTPDTAGGRAVDLNDMGQVCGYSQGPLSGFGAFRWDAEGGMQFLGALDLAYSYATHMNDAGQVVGYARSASGNTTKPWIWSDGAGMQAVGGVSSGFPAAINDNGQVIGTRTCCGPDEPWLWTPQTGMVELFDLFNYVAAGLSGPTSHDINDAGQILLHAYDNNAGEFRTVVLTPVDPGGACCLGDASCLPGTAEGDCLAQGGQYLGDGTPCLSCAPTGACCLTDGTCVPFLSENACSAMLGSWQGSSTSCANATCTAGLPNDDCADAAPIGTGEFPFTTLGATTDGPTAADACGGAFSFGQDIWYLYEPEGAGTLTVTTCGGADFDTKLAAYEGGCGGLQLVACNDDFCPGLYALMEVPVQCAVPVLIRVGGFSTNSGNGTLGLSFQGAACAGCPSDVNDDQMVDVSDLVAVILAWGTRDVAADVNGDGTVNVSDLVEVISAWGPCN